MKAGNSIKCLLGIFQDRSFPGPLLSLHSPIRRSRWRHVKIPHPGNITYDQNPYPGDRPQSQIPMVRPTLHPRAWHWKMHYYIFCTCIFKVVVMHGWSPCRLPYNVMFCFKKWHQSKQYHFREIFFPEADMHLVPKTQPYCRHCTRQTCTQLKWWQISMS